MLKKLSVGKKIMGGFIIVLVIMVIVMAINTFTSFARNDDLTQVQSYAGMQLTANHLRKSFNEARANATIVFDKLDSTDEYNLCMQEIAETQEQAVELERYSQELGDYQKNAILSLKQSLADWKQAVTEVYNYNLLMEETRVRLITDSQNLAVSTTALLEDVARLTIQLSGSQELTSTVWRIEQAILPAAQLSEAVDDMRIESAKLILTFDDSVVDGLHTRITDVMAKSEELYANLTTNEARASIREMQDKLKEYQEALDAFVATMQQCDVEVQQAGSLMAEVFANIEGGTKQIDADMQNNLSKTITTSTMTTILMLVLTVVMIVSSIAIALILTRIITRPLSTMKDVLVQVGETGKMDFSPQVKEGLNKDAESKDEVGQSIQAFRNLIERLEYLSEGLQHLAAGNLRIDVNLLSSEDSMGIAMKDMVDNLNHMFEEIRRVSAQVATGSGEISQGAQQLAQGATEQSSTIQEITSSMLEIKHQAAISEQTAQKATDDNLEIKASAQTGNESMNRMMTAMQEINDASRSIEQVIKTVDDIAFQTNILALNAAVEAARAGEHGKGFAVVAEEVRNLASKSSNAAAQTAALIAANIEKAEMGLSISQETASSLDEIVEAVEKTSESLQAVANQAQSTSAATIQITEAMEQVAQVVAQNSATSEQSAAASEEMNSQAQSLQALIGRFKLKSMTDIPALEQPAGWSEQESETDYPLFAEGSKY